MIPKLVFSLLEVDFIMNKKQKEAKAFCFYIPIMEWIS